MGVFGYIRKAKERFDQERYEGKANKLAGLRSERLKQEGRVKIDRAYNKEKSRIASAKKEQFNNSFTGRAVSNLQKFQKASKKRSAKISRSKSISTSRTEINPAFDMDKKKKSIFD